MIYGSLSLEKLFEFIPVRLWFFCSSLLFFYKVILWIFFNNFQLNILKTNKRVKHKQMRALQNMIIIVVFCFVFSTNERTLISKFKNYTNSLSRELEFRDMHGCHRAKFSTKSLECWQIRKILEILKKFRLFFYLDKPTNSNRHLCAFDCEICVILFFFISFI